jgi:hypothetical protein
MVSQVAAAGRLPAHLTPALVAALCLSSFVFLARVTEHLPSNARAWKMWQALMAVIGIITVPQVLWGTFTGSHSLIPAALASLPGVLH